MYAGSALNPKPTFPIGPIVVSSWGSYVESYKVSPKRNYYELLWGLWVHISALCFQVPPGAGKVQLQAILEEPKSSSSGSSVLGLRGLGG